MSLDDEEKLDDLNDDGTCTRCGSHQIILAAERTTYCGLKKEGGVFKRGGNEVLDTDYRVYCFRCMTYFNVPDGIE